MSQLAWTCDELGNATWYNKRWIEYTGMPADDLKGWNWSKVHHPDHLDRVIPTVQRASEAGEPWEDTFPMRGVDGRYRWFLSRAVPIRDETGDIVTWFGTNTDVTKEREAEEALREADRRKDEFLATLAHELRNPLAPIRNGLHILRVSGSDGGVAERIYEIMDRQVGHLVRLVDDLMEVSRITLGKLELRTEPVDLQDLVRSAVETCRPFIDAARHQLDISLPPEPIILDGDPVRLSQVLANLLNNAAKYTDEGGQIRLAVERKGSSAVISIRDTGMGIAAEMLPRIFDPFIQVDQNPDRAAGGLGIGLTLVRTLVSMHGGTSEARSDGPGRGSEFVVRLPIVAPPARAHNGTVRGGRAATVGARRILVVDDNRDAAESLAMLLKTLGAEVVTAHDGAGALQALHAFRPAVALLDIGMPGMDGLEVARRARQTPEGQAVTLIALTGWGQAEDRRQSKKAGFDHHLVKPVDPLALQVLLEALP
jgi:PAS domain S-box-containing protein